MTLFLAFFAGCASWTFAEYALHNWWGHWAKGRNEFSREHLKHHADPHYFAPTAKKVRMALPAVTLIAGIGSLVAGLGPGLLFAAGFTATYVLYEVLHRRMHTHPPRNGYGRWARRHHLYHHHGNPSLNHGVTTALWDHVFRTWSAPGQLRLTERHVEPWMRDPDTGGLRTEFEADYLIVQKRRAG